ncbi:3-hydroxybenzoate 6-hydroxylase [Fusarium oxysporum f. sp. cubense race 1]|uniref:3-hydroxybenzoate 6-hydroxylase n=1 Tax=Fusarium oxysporum f. sp. cubense (strain race 1) TaxID=1229664 RepID=N4U7E0_FUSC1|nr:3-hydroxybenzoate 6-hydroxylase [Fusarium oxysporum f. sp. cubense race 1]
MTLKVGIIGAGIGGLSAAIALRRTGAQVEVFERSNFKDETGAAITITPNGMRVLRHLGFDPKTARGVQNKQMRMVDPHTLEDLVVENFSHVEDDYGAPFMFFHRVDLHTALKEMALSSDERYLGSPVVIHNGNSVTSLDCERATILLDNGEAFRKDLVVVADGVRASPTKLIDEITRKDAPLEDIGSSFYRCLIPFSEVNKNPDLEAIFKHQDPGFWVPFELSTGTFLVTYPCRNGKMLNVAFRHKTKAENEYAVDWNTDTNIQDITAMVGRFNPLVAKLFSLSTSVSVHKLFRREPLETYTRERAVIIGDAAHPIQPTHAQGAVLAIEEAAALEALFKDMRSPEKVAERLGLYNDILKRRIHVTQLLSDAQPGISSVLRKRAEDIWGEGIFPPEAMNFTKPIRDFFYAWDVMKEAEKILARAI